FLHLARLEAAANLDEPIGQRRFAVINVGDDGEISDQVLLPTAHSAQSAGRDFSRSRLGDRDALVNRCGSSDASRVWPAASSAERFASRFAVTRRAPF